MALFCGTERLDRVFRIGLVAIEEMFRIVNDLFGIFLEVCHGRLDHVEVFRERRADHVRYMQIPALTKNRLDRSFRLDQSLQKRIVFRQDFRTTRTAKRGNLRVLELYILNKLEKFFVSRIARVRPTALDIVKSKMVQNSCNLHLVG